MNKTITFITISMLGSIISTPVTAQILITKIKTSGTTATDEYVELYNNTPFPTSLTGWTLKKRTAGGTESNLVTAFPSSTIQGYGYFLIGHKNFTTTSTQPDIWYSSQDSLASNNAAMLFDPEKSLINEVCWGTISSSQGLPAPNPTNHTVLSRLWNEATENHADTNDSSKDFVETTDEPRNSLYQNQLIPTNTFPSSPETSTTPDHATESSDTTPTNNDNETIVYSSPSQLILNEIMPNPAEGAEWVEIYNPSPLPINLAGMTLCDARTTSCTISELEGIIQPTTYKVIYLKSNYLNNGGDTVTLLDRNKNILETMIYGPNHLTAEKEVSIVKSEVVSQPSSTWTLTMSPTPGEPNRIISPPTRQPTPEIHVVSPPQSEERPKPEKLSQKAVKEQKVEMAYSLKTPPFAITQTPNHFSLDRIADPRGGVVFVTWNFGDNTSAEGEHVSHTYTTPGIYTVTAKSVSTQGTSSTAQSEIRVFLSPEHTSGFLSEIMNNPEQNNESYIELTNPTTDTVDMGGWQLQNIADKSYTIPERTLVQPGKYITLYEPITHLTLSKNNDVVMITNSTTILDLAHTPTSTRGLSYSLLHSQWIWKSPTPGLNNDVLDSGTTSTLSQTTTAKTKIQKRKSTAAPKNLTIAEALTKTKGTLVRLEGTVTAAPGELSKHYFYIGDQTRGVQIYSSSEIEGVKRGDKVKLTGKVSEANDTTRITLQKNTLIKTGRNDISPITFKKTNEVLLGNLLTITGEITEKSSNRLYINTPDNEWRVRISKNCVTDAKIGDTITVTGIYIENTEELIIAPRSSYDIQVSVVQPAKTSKKTFSLFNWFK